MCIYTFPSSLFFPLKILIAQEDAALIPQLDLEYVQCYSPTMILLAVTFFQHYYSTINL